MIATLQQVLTDAMARRYVVPGLVVLGWEDALAYTKAGEEAGLPVILQAGPGCRKHTPLAVLGPMFRHLAESVDTPVVAHLDHATDIEDCRLAIDHGFSSVMFDGSRLPLAENIEQTRAVVEMAHTRDVSVEGEIGFVGYDAGEDSAGTDPEEARQFAEDTGVDAMAVSIGNVHLQKTQKAEIDFDALAAIQEATEVPLVLHGSSGIPHDIRMKIARETNVCKMNIGTELRQVFGQSLRDTLDANPARFDRIEILRDTIAPLQTVARNLISDLGTCG